MTDKTTDVSSTESPGSTSRKKSTASTGKQNEFSSLLQELKQDRESRDGQFTALLDAVRQGLGDIYEDMDERDARRNKEFSLLVSGLDKAFTRVENTTTQRDGRNDEMIAKLSESIILEHQTLQEEVQEKEKLHEKKLEQLDKIHREQVRRTRLIAIPGVITAIFAVIYMFYTVHVMEKAMTSMSQDMRSMKTSMETVSYNTSGIAANMGYMRRDMGVMTHNVAPAMQGMRQMMPWGP